MPFRLVANPTFDWPVRFSLPSAEESGAYAEHGFTARFRLLSRAAIDELIVKVRREGWSVDRFVGEIVESVRDVTDEQDQPLPHTPELLAQVCAVPGVAQAIVDAYLRATSSNREAQAKPAAAH